MSGLAICSRIGTEIAYPLFSQTNTTGNLCAAAKFTPSWKSPWLVAPSPNVHSVTAPSADSFDAYALPAAFGIHAAATCATGAILSLWEREQPPGMLRPARI